MTKSFTGRAGTFLGGFLPQQLQDKECSELVCGNQHSVAVSVSQRQICRACVYTPWKPGNPSTCTSRSTKMSIACQGRPKPLAIYNSHDLIIPLKSLYRPLRITFAFPIKRIWYSETFLLQVCRVTIYENYYLSLPERSLLQLNLESPGGGTVLV